VPNDVIDTICPTLSTLSTHTHISERDASFLRQSHTSMQHSIILSMNRVNHRLIETHTQDMREREREPHKISLSLLLAASPSLASPPSLAQSSRCSRLSVFGRPRHSISWLSNIVAHLI